MAHGALLIDSVTAHSRSEDTAVSSSIGFLDLSWSHPVQCSGITGQMGSRQLKTCSERRPGAGPEGGTLTRTFKHCGFKAAKHQMGVNIGFGE